MNVRWEATHVRETFVVQVISAQNATWQGVVTWAEGKRKQPFRSALELLKLIDSSLEEEAADEAQEE
ncbi:hypothetical protein INF37_13345 [Pseudoflavonifractor sp. DSM 107456]|uniref:Transcriptional coactivator p15 (PC4) C-terminal domain-containing protein n=1 Tax=Pseudoflavonifractor gallinarum TaxID=2779352 RepID=A0ABR9RE46_9FIRM|nr:MULTISPECIES: hypothetical protein [Eubacteriales]MBE5056972.1 hypothetical protein [Pseudoflavonifractor gallinarum]MBS5134930.1 hypothetical protein [Oscillospiraceae bacterium]MBT9683869.1 hypothetical protein [Pseudoflavonifractor sp. MCC625]